MELFREERKLENNYYNLGNLLKIGKENNIPISSLNLSIQVSQMTESIIASTKTPPRGSIQQEFKARGFPAEILIAGSYYTKLIKPWLASGSDSHKPSTDDIIEFCKKLITGADVVFYYAFSKTQSPGRTGSPNWVIDYAELEMLKHWALLTLTAQELEMNLRIILIDETPALPFDEYLGLKENDLIINQELFGEFLRLMGNPPIVYRSLMDSVSSPLGEAFNEKYKREQEKLLTSINRQLTNGVISPETIKIVTFLDCLPESTLNIFRLNPEILQQIISSFRNGDFNPLLSINSKLLNYLTSLTAHFSALMSLRSDAGNIVRGKNMIEKFPEYNDGRIYGGVTRSQRRWSFLPHPKKFKGQTVNPMHGLAVYDETGEFLGISQKRHLPPESKIIDIGSKPLFVII